MKYLLNTLAVIFLALSFSSCSFDELTPEYSNIHDPKSDKYIPSDPYNLSISAATDSSVTLTWTDGSLGEKGFIIERAESNGILFITIDIVKENTTMYIDKFNVKLGVKYLYRIRALTGTHKSGYSNTAETKVEIKTPSAPVLVDSKMVPLGLAWEDNSTFRTGFVVEWRVFGEEKEFKKLTETEAKRNWFDLPALDNNKIYQFRVIAKTGRNISAPSDLITVYYGLKASNAHQLNASPGAGYVGFSPVSNEFFAGGENYYSTPFKIYNADAGSEVRTFIGGTGGFAAYNPSGSLIAVGTSYLVQWQVYSRVTIFDAATGEELKLIPGAGRALDFSPDGRYLAIGAHRTEYDHPKELSLLDMTTYKKIWTINSYDITKVKMSRDGSKIIAVSDESYRDKILIFNAADGTLLKEIETDSYYIGDLQMNYQNNQFAFATGGSAGSEPGIEIWDLEAMAKVKQINVSASSFAYMHNSEYMAVSSDVVRIFRLSDGLDMGPLYPGAAYRGATLSFNKDDHYLAAGGSSPVIFTLTKTWRAK